MNIDVWYYHAKYVPNICQMAITVTSISDKDDVSCESSNSWYFRVSYLRSMHTSQEHSGLMGFKNFVHKFQDYFAAKIQIIWEVHKILKTISNFVLTLGHRFSQNANQNFKDFCPGSLSEGRNPKKIWLAFWEKRWPEEFILNLTDL